MRSCEGLRYFPKELFHHSNGNTLKRKFIFLTYIYEKELLRQPLDSLSQFLWCLSGNKLLLYILPLFVCDGFGRSMVLSMFL